MFNIRVYLDIERMEEQPHEQDNNSGTSIIKKVVTTILLNSSFIH